MKFVSIQRSWLLSLSSPLQHSLPSSYVCMCMPTCFCMCMHLYIRYNLLLPFFSLTLFFLLLNWTWPLSIKGTRNFSFVAYIYTLVRRKEEREQQWWLKKKKKMMHMRVCLCIVWMFFLFLVSWGCKYIVPNHWLSR